MGPIDLQALLRRLAGNRPTRSIRQLLTRLVLSIMVPLLAFSALVLWRFTELQQQRAEQEALAAATALASDIDRDIRGIIAALTGLASSPALLSDDFATFYVQAQQVATAVGVPILLRDGASGQQVLNTRLPFGAELPLNDPSGIATRVVASRVPYVSNLVFGTVAQKQLVAVAVPVMRGSDVVAVLIASVEGGRIGGVMAEQRLPDMWTLAVSDRDGMIIARSKDADAFIGRRSNLFDANSGRQGVHRVTNLEGIVVLRGYRHTEQGWLVASFTPLRFVNGPLRESWLAFVAIGVVLFALALPLTLYFAGRIAQSIREIADRAAALERGDAMPPIRTNIMEVAVVSELMNATATTLRNRELLLAESAARFRSAFEQAAVGFAQTGLDGRWIAVNSRFCELLGRSQSDCLQLTAAAVTHPDDLLVETPLIQQVRDGSLPSASVEKRYMKPDGNTVWVRSTTSLVRDSEGAPKYYVSVIEDITTGQAARAATARLAALVQASNDAILSVTRDGMIDTWNPGAERLFGYTAADVVGQHARILGGFAKSSQAREMLDRCLAGEPARVEVDFRHKDHTVIDVAMSVSPIGSNGAVTGLSVMIEDIRERRKWQRQQHLLNRELQHRVKNSLAVVQSIANQTQRSSPTLERFRTAFQGRLQALAAANDRKRPTNHF